MKFCPEWDWVVEPWVLAVSAPCYLAVVLGLKWVMEGKEAMELGVVLRGFNALQIGVSAVMAWQLSGELSLFNPFMINTEFKPHTEWWLLVHYFAKWVDLLESVIIVLRKRNSQLTNLHLFHHSSILIIWGSLLHMGLANGTAAYGAFINSFVHAVMYGHLYSHGDAKCMVVVINKTSVVLCQILQFLSCILHAGLAVFVDTTIPTPVCLVQLGYNILLVSLFLNAARQAKQSRQLRQQQLRSQNPPNSPIRSQMSPRPKFSDHTPEQQQQQQPLLDEPDDY